MALYVLLTRNANITLLKKNGGVTIRIYDLKGNQYIWSHCTFRGGCSNTRIIPLDMLLRAPGMFLFRITYARNLGPN